MRWWRRNVSTTCSPSPRRSSPVSTNTQVSWGPTALCTRAAATAESTPPERAQITRASPTWARIASTCCSMIEVIVQVGGMPARWWRKWRSSCCPKGVCETSGWCCTAQMRRSGDSSAATGAPSVVAVARNPSGTRVMPSKWLIQTVWCTGWSANRPEPSVTVSSVRPYSPVPPRATSPPSCWATSWAP